MFRYLVSVPVIFLCLLLVFIIMIITLQLQVRVCASPLSVWGGFRAHIISEIGSVSIAC